MSGNFYKMISMICLKIFRFQFSGKCGCKWMGFLGQKIFDLNRQNPVNAEELQERIIDVCNNITVRPLENT
ncbi:hypothetical protein BDFB_008881, partial [Asbolus verrucosus]